jgi:DNA modification methylase
MLEIDPRYCQVIIDRWQSYTGQKAAKVTEGKQLKAKTSADTHGGEQND